MEILIHENGPFMVNTYLLVNGGGKNCVIIDPGNDCSGLIGHIREKELVPGAIIATHGHVDHVEGVTQFKREFDVPFYANKRDRDLIKTAGIQARMFGIPDPGEITVDHDLPEEGVFDVAGFQFTCLHTPGHSPGSVSLLIDNAVFTGDALFHLSIGRTDLPGGSYGELIESIRERLFTLDNETRVLPGHGPGSTIGAEKAMNPFFR